jgi:hypothetical protein
MPQHVPIGDFGIRTKSLATESSDEYFFRELRTKHPELGIVVCGTSVYSDRWREVADVLMFRYVKIGRRLNSRELLQAIKGAKELVT